MVVFFCWLTLPKVVCCCFFFVLYYYVYLNILLIFAIITTRLMMFYFFQIFCCVLGSAMAKKLDMIKDIDGKRETLKLVVRVVDHWYVQSRDSNLQLEMILMDENVSIS